MVIQGSRAHHTLSLLVLRAELGVPSWHSWDEMSPRAWPRGRLHPVLPWPRLRERLLASVSHTVLCRLWRKPHFCTSLSTSLSLCFSLSLSVSLSSQQFESGCFVVSVSGLLSPWRFLCGAAPGWPPAQEGTGPGVALGPLLLLQLQWLSLFEELPIPLQNFQAWVSPGQPSSWISPILGTGSRAV